MKATYIGTGDRGDDHICTVFGRDFPLNEAVDVSDLDPAHKERLRGNPTFQTEGGEPLTDAKGEPITAASGEPLTAGDKFDALSDDDLRIYLAGRDGKAPHPKTGRPKLLAAARGDAAAKAEAEDGEGVAEGDGA